MGFAPSRELSCRRRAAQDQGARPFVWGDKDVLGKPDICRRALDLMPRARLEVVGGGHVPWLDDGQRVGRVIGHFLEEQGLSQ